MATQTKQVKATTKRIEGKDRKSTAGRPDGQTSYNSRLQRLLRTYVDRRHGVLVSISDHFFDYLRLELAD